MTGPLGGAKVERAGISLVQRAQALFEAERSAE